MTMHYCRVINQMKCNETFKTKINRFYTVMLKNDIAKKLKSINVLILKHKSMMSEIKLYEA